MSKEKKLEEEINKIATVLKDGLIPTRHPRVFYKSKNDVYSRGELAFSEDISKQFPKYTVIITMGPWRVYDVGFEVDYIAKTIALDFYSPAYTYTAHLGKIS